MTSIDQLALTIWDYHRLHQPLQKADVLFVLGGHDLRVPEYAAKLYHEGWAPRVAISGGIAHTGDMLETGWHISEAEKFAEVMMAHGVPPTVMTLEKTATNTGENFLFTRPLLGDFSSALVVTKPYMERRAFATGLQRWPDKTITLSSPPLSFEEYVAANISKDDVIMIMMGDLQRIDVYGKNGFQVPQEIPDDVWGAFNELRQLGYTKHLLTP